MTKRLIAKPNNDQQLADFIFKKGKEFFNWNFDEVANFLKRKMGSSWTVDELLADEYELKDLLTSALLNALEIYDSTVDKFYSDTLEEAEKNDPMKSGSQAKIKIDYIIQNLDRYGYDVKQVMNKKVINKMKDLEK